jgi:DNA (cytosine-5)-methyltransferase 1
MQIIDTFSGIGGFSYAGAMMGWRTVQFCEMNEFCNKILSFYWPGVPIHTDIKTLTADQIINNGLYDKNETTILTGGVPCQPWSLAGKRKGEEDDRNLWPQTIELIGSLRPDFAVLENVPGFFNWNKGVFLEQMLTSLEAQGYEVFPVVLPACGVNAPHKRERIWFVAHSVNGGYRAVRGENGEADGIQGINRETLHAGLSDGTNRGVICNSESKGLEGENRIGMEKSNEFAKSIITNSNIRGRSEHGLQTGWSLPKGTTFIDSNNQGRKRNRKQPEPKEQITFGSRHGQWDNFPTQSPLCSRDDGFSSRLDGITFPKFRNESIKAYGNAIVPAVALQIFKAIQQIEDL